MDDSTPGGLIDGHTLDELSDYLDRGQWPRNASIDNSPACQIALSGLRRLREMGDAFLEDEAAAEPPREESWMAALIDNLRIEAHAGRNVPVDHPDPEADLHLTEGALRDLIRRAGDDVDGVLVGRTQLLGDITTIGEPVQVSVEAAVQWGHSIPALVPLLRAAILRDLRQHAELNITALDVTVTDVFTIEDEDAS